MVDTGNRLPFLAPEMPEDDPDAPPTAEEVAAATNLREAIEATSESPDTIGTPELALVRALQAAWSPSSLNETQARSTFMPASHEANELPTNIDTTADERAQARALREALARSDHAEDHEMFEVHLARALRAAHAPTALPPEAHRAIVEAALDSLRRSAPPRRGALLRVAFGTAAAGLALAASVALLIATPPSEAPLAEARTTQPLFSKPFTEEQGSARIDRIASARAADLRSNRFAKWGLR